MGNELKSPSMARRIAKNQEHMEKSLAPSLPLLPSAPTPMRQQMQPPTPPPNSAVCHTNTLPNISPCAKPKVGRQRSISDLLSTPCEPPTTSVPFGGGSSIPSSMCNYNPYASDRSISHPPATPPPITPSTPVDRSSSLPPI